MMSFTLNEYKVRKEKKANTDENSIIILSHVYEVYHRRLEYFKGINMF